MTLSDNRWHIRGPSEYPWEQEALDYLRQRLPDRDPWHVWPNVEFISGSGAVYEVDALVLSPSGLWVLEIKSRPGKLQGDHQYWHFTHEGRTTTVENPVWLANRKAKALKGVLEANRTQKGLAIPWIAPLIFLSSEELSCELDIGSRAWVCVREDRPAVARGNISGVLSALETGKVVGTERGGRDSVRRRDVSGIVRTIEASVRAATRVERVSDYRLTDLIDEGPGYQDRVAEHSETYGTRRRARCYLVAQGTSAEERERIQRAAEREFAILDRISHPGILPVKHIASSEHGPVLMFEYNPDAQRLDQWLAGQEAVDQSTALDILEQLYDAIRTAHNHTLIHRALSPRSILIAPSDDLQGSPHVQIFNWQTALYLRESTSKASLTGTVHVDSLVEDAAAAYIAPEAIGNPQDAAEVADVFSLGAIAFRLFSGQAPAANHLELVQTLSENRCLRLSAVCNGVPQVLDDLTANSTQANPLLRWGLDEFGHQLQQVWEELTEPPVEVLHDPLLAQKGQKLRADESREVYEVTDRLGLGATALAVRAQNPDKKAVVLKIARGADHNAILEKEHEVLSRLHDPTVVRVEELISMSSHTTIVMQDAGESLAERLRSEGRLSFEMLQTLGEDLLHAVDYLESQGVFHRDLKPENMGIQDASLASKKRLSLVLFDFSLVSAPLQSLTVGTQQYLDPFLKLRHPAVYDTHAERYAVAVSLYEMATGTHPQWGNGLADPAADSSCDLAIDSGLFPASCRDDMADFFEKALNRDPAARFHNAREMLRAWIQIFESAEEVAEARRGDIDQAKAIAEATLVTPLDGLGLSTRTLNALDRINVLGVRDLLRLREGDLIGVRGIGYKTKREIFSIRRQLKERFPDEKEEARPSEPDFAGTTLSQAQEASVDHLFERVTGRGGRDEKAQEYRDALLGLSQPEPAPKHPWPTQAEVADHFGVTRAAISISWGHTREAWWRSVSLKELRDDVHLILERQGGVMSAEELGEAILAQRGSLLSDHAIRRRNALAVGCAALALEERQDEPRFRLYRRTVADLVARSSELADYAAQLGQVADELAQEWPPPSPARTSEKLRNVVPPADGGDGDRIAAISDRRLIALAAAASQKACLASNHQELYPAGMDPEKALRLASGSLLGLASFKPQEIQDRVNSRYPRAQLLPGRPELDRLLQECEIGLDWSESERAYVRPKPMTTRLSNMSLLRSAVSGTPRRAATPPEQEEADRCQQRLRESLRGRQFLAIQVAAHYALYAQRALLDRFPELDLVNVDELMLSAMREQTEAIGARWDVVLRADAANRNSSDWQRLSRLVGERVMPAIRKRLTKSERPMLIVNPGLLARYDQVGVLEELRDLSGTPDGPPGCWVLIPTSSLHAMPLIDGKPLPLIGSIQNLVLPRTWTAGVLNGTISEK